MSDLPRTENMARKYTRTSDCDERVAVNSRYVDSASTLHCQLSSKACICADDASPFRVRNRTLYLASELNGGSR
jgi:hypothetical protein